MLIDCLKFHSPENAQENLIKSFILDSFLVFFVDNNENIEFAFRVKKTSSQ